MFYTKTDDHGIRWDNTRQILARLWCSVVSRVALDLPYWAMRSAPYCLICMAIELASEAAAFFLLLIMCRA